MHVLDLIFGLAARGPLFFPDGWGDRDLCEALDPTALARLAPAAHRRVTLPRSGGGRKPDRSSPLDRVRVAFDAEDVADAKGVGAHHVRLEGHDVPVAGRAVHNDLDLRLLTQDRAHRDGAHPDFGHGAVADVHAVRAIGRQPEIRRSDPHDRQGLDSMKLLSSLIRLWPLLLLPLRVR